MAGIGDRMKKYEAAAETFADVNQPMIIRVDGHCFSKFTRGFEKPFDSRLHSVMVSTAEDLLQHHSDATSAYTQSDEISLLFPAGTQAFNGRVQKLASLAAAYASVRFNYHLTFILKEELPHKQGIAHFDARVFCLAKPEELLNNILWRCRYDCQRNAKSAFARLFMNSKQTHKLNTTEQIDIVREKFGRDYYTEVPDWAQWGSLIKREWYQHEGSNPKTGSQELTMRTRMSTRDLAIDNFSDQNLKLLVTRYWPA